MNQMIQKMVPPYLLARLGMTLRVSFIVSLLLLAQWTSLAATIIVVNPLDGLGPNTLRGAVTLANRVGGNVTIKLAGGTFPLTAGELALRNGNVTIIGAARTSTIRSAGSSRIFHVFPGANVTLQNLVLTGGKSANSSGGAIRNEGSLNLQNCTIKGNTAASGAGIFNSGTLVMNGDWVSDNDCNQGQGGSGGGIYNSGQLTANNCVISNNVCGMGAMGGTGSTDSDFRGGTGLVIQTVLSGSQFPGGDGGGGGGVYNDGTMTLNACFVMDNATGNGGGARMDGASGGAGGNGGGILNADTLALSHCVVGGNTCGNGGSGTLSGSPGSGGGIFNALGATAQVFNSLVSLNVPGRGGLSFSGSHGPNGLGPDVAGNFTSLGYNLITAADNSIGFTNNVRNDIVGSIASPADPRLFHIVVGP